MKIHALCLSLAVTAAQAAPTLESAKTTALQDTPAPAVKFAPAPARQPFFLDPKAAPLRDGSLVGETIGSLRLADQLDRHRSLARLKLGARAWDVSLAGDAGFSSYYLTLRDGSDLRIAPLGDINRLRGEGIDIQSEPGVVYNFHVTINIFNPVRGSTLEIKPTRGTRGPSYALKSGQLLDAVRDHSYVFSADGAEYWTLYGTDVDPATGGLAQTRSFLFVHLNGLSSNAWPVAESALPEGEPRGVTFQSALTLRRAAGELTILRP